MTNKNEPEGEAHNVQYPRRSFVEAVRDLDDPVGTQAVADEVGCSYELAHQRLHDLAGKGELDKQKIANSNLWKINE